MGQQVTIPLRYAERIETESGLAAPEWRVETGGFEWARWWSQASPISKSLSLLSTCPWGQPSAQRKADGRLAELGIALSHRGLSCLALLLAGTSVAGFLLSYWARLRSEAASSFPVGWPETIHAKWLLWGSCGPGVQGAQQLALLHCETINAQNFCSIPRGLPRPHPSLKCFCIHYLPTGPVVEPKRGSRLSIIMNSEWNGVVGDYFS